MGNKFDPATGKLIDPEGLRSIQMQPAGRRVPFERIIDRNTREREVIHDGDGKTEAIITDRADGSNDVHAFARVVKAEATVPAPANITQLTDPTPS